MGFTFSDSPPHPYQGVFAWYLVAGWGHAMPPSLDSRADWNSSTHWKFQLQSHNSRVLSHRTLPEFCKADMVLIGQLQSPVPSKSPALFWKRDGIVIFLHREALNYQTSLTLSEALQARAITPQWPSDTQIMFSSQKLLQWPCTVQTPVENRGMLVWCALIPQPASASSFCSCYTSRSHNPGVVSFPTNTSRSADEWRKSFCVCAGRKTPLWYSVQRHCWGSWSCSLYWSANHSTSTQHSPGDPFDKWLCPYFQ